MPREFIVYACPIGPLAQRIDGFYERTLRKVGHNRAHDYMAHCTLTGFFHDEVEAIPSYVNALDEALARARSTQPTPVVRILGVELQENFHGLLLDSPWLKALTADFAAAVDSPSRRDDLRLKDWLHLSLAYDFPPEQGPKLARIAKEMIDIHLPVHWDLRFYERHVKDGWISHVVWPLDS